VLNGCKSITVSNANANSPKAANFQNSIGPIFAPANATRVQCQLGDMSTSSPFPPPLNSSCNVKAHWRRFTMRNNRRQVAFDVRFFKFVRTGLKIWAYLRPKSESSLFRTLQLVRPALRLVRARVLCQMWAPCIANWLTGFRRFLASQGSNVTYTILNRTVRISKFLVKVSVKSFSLPPIAGRKKLRARLLQHP